MYGWTVRECLSMPATQFFSMLKAGKELEFQSRARFFTELCDVAFIPLGGEKYSKELRQIYDRYAYPEKKNKKVLDASDPGTAATLAALLRPGRR